MTDVHIEKTLEDAFLTLNDFSGIPYIKFDGNGKPLNVATANREFVVPKDQRYFILTYLPASVEAAGLGSEAYNRFLGVLQIDIVTPLNTGLDEMAAKLDWLTKLFCRGAVFDDVIIKKSYRAMQEATETAYRTVLRIEVTSTLPKN